MPKFLILMREDDHAWSRLPEAERDRLLAKYVAWAQDLGKRGHLLDGNPMGAGGMLLRSSPEGVVTMSRYEERHQVETGYFVVEAPDLAAAAQLARACPALTHGETVVVRPLGH